MDKKALALIVLILVITISRVYAYQTFYAIENAEMRIRDSNVTAGNSTSIFGENNTFVNPSEPTAQPTLEPTPTLSTAKNTTGELFYCYEFFVKPELQTDFEQVEETLVVYKDEVFKTHGKSFYYHVNEGNYINGPKGWTQVYYWMPVPPELEAKLSTLCDSRGLVMYIWHVNVVRIRDGEIPFIWLPDMPDYGEAIQW